MASLKEYPEPAVIRAVLSTLSLGLDARRPGRGPDVLRQPGDESGHAEQVEVAGQGGGIAGVIELAEHLGVRQDLTGVGGCQLEQPLQESRLVDPCQREDVALDVRLHHRPENVVAPAVLISDQTVRLGVASEVQVVRQVVAERGGDFGERPVCYADRLEAAGKALAQAGLHQ